MRVCRAEIACSHVCTYNSGEGREHCRTGPCSRSSEKGGLGLLPLTPQNKVHSVIPVAGGRETQTLLQRCHQALPPPKVGEEKGAFHGPRPLQSPGLGSMTQTENPASVPADCRNQTGSGGGEKVRRRERLPESFPTPLQCPNGTSRGPHQGPALEP